MKKEIKISEENALNAYDNASAEGKELLEHLLGKEVFMQKDITERIKTFDDALQELSRRAEACDDDAAALLADYESNAMDIENPQTVAYMKLTIIVNALNEGWVPQFTKDEVRYFPFYWLYTKDEVDAMDDDQRSRLLFVGGPANNGSSLRPFGVECESRLFGLVCEPRRSSGFQDQRARLVCGKTVR